MSYNPTLSIRNVTTHNKFVCFSVKAEHGKYKDNNTLEITYLKGCTFADENFCSGWQNVKILECSGACTNYLGFVFVAMVVAIILNQRQFL